MASPVDIVLAVRANVRDALTGLDKVRQSAKAANAEVSKTDRALQTIAKRGEMIRGRARSGFGGFAGTLAAGGSLTEALSAGLGGAFPKVATSLVAGRAAGGFFDRLQGDDAAIASAQALLANPTSVPEAAAALKSLANRQAGKFSWGRWLRQGGDLFTGKDGRLAFNPGGYDRGRELRRAFKDLARSNLPLAIAVAAQLGNPADLVKIIGEVQGEQARAIQSQRFLAGLPGAASTSITNVYTAFDGLGGRNSQGRQVRSVLDARDRNNGRYQQPSRR